MAQTVTCSMCGREFTIRSAMLVQQGAVVFCPDCTKSWSVYYWDRLKTRPLAVLWQVAVLIAAIAFLTWPIWSRALSPFAR